MADCNEAIRLDASLAAAFDLRGFTYLKLGQWEAAIGDYGSALRIDPKSASALYGRGLAELKSGDPAGGNTDIAAAAAIEHDIRSKFAGYGLYQSMLRKSGNRFSEKTVLKQYAKSDNRLSLD